MTWLPSLALFLVAWLGVFAQTQFLPLTQGLGAPVNILPALIVYASLTSPSGVMAALTVFAALGLDSLAAHPFGVSLLPLFAVGFALQLRRHLILRDQTYAQFWLGLAGGLAVPLLTWALLRMGSRPLIEGPFLLWQWLVSGLLNGLLCPALFRLFDAVRRTFEYQPVISSSFRPDREIKRGRR